MVNDQIERFRAALERVKGECLVVNDQAALRTALASWLEGCGCRRIGVSRHPIVGEALAGSTPEILPLQGTDVDAVVTGADVLIAETGTVAITATPDCPRSMLFLPPIHVVVTTASQVVPDLASCLREIQTKGWSFPALTLITGPSRTADIEKVLVMGAHGPKRLAVFVTTHHQ